MKNTLFSLAYRMEDFLVRLFVKYPKKDRVNSFPFLNSDTYSFLCDQIIDSCSQLDLISDLSSSSRLYINGNLFPGLEQQFLSHLSKRKALLSGIFIGDSDKSPSESFIKSVQKHSSLLGCVNLEIRIKGVLPLPLGLESQRYRSAGQIRDFQKLPDLNPSSRPIGVLVAWNDDTNLAERTLAREEISGSQHCQELRKRFPARHVHFLMRRSLFVACPPGNGMDTHRFWESLYLGSLPIILKRHEIPAFKGWPYFALNDWGELRKLSRNQLVEVYLNKVPELLAFRKGTITFIKKTFNSLKEVL